MNGLTIIYILAGFAFGVLVGLIVELIIDTQTIAELRERNNKLRLENAALRQEAPKGVIEIIDRRSAEAGEYFKPF